MKAPVVSSNGVPMPSAAKAMSTTATRPRSLRASGRCRGVVKTISGSDRRDAIAANLGRKRRARKPRRQWRRERAMSARLAGNARRCGLAEGATAGERVLADDAAAGPDGSAGEAETTGATAAVGSGTGRDVDPPAAIATTQPTI